MTTKTNKYNYKTIFIPASQLISPRETYQRELVSPRAKEIAGKFDERIANEPKVSYRDGKYYVFDGQHTIGARILVSGNKDVPIKCKVYYGMDEQEEALLFAQQNGVSAPLTAGARMRAKISARTPKQPLSTWQIFLSDWRSISTTTVDLTASVVSKLRSMPTSVSERNAIWRQ